MAQLAFLLEKSGMPERSEQGFEGRGVPAVTGSTVRLFYRPGYGDASRLTPRRMAFSAAFIRGIHELIFFCRGMRIMAG